MKILILGGYGTFGGRLAHLLADDSRLTLVLAGRSKQKAEKFCQNLPIGANKIALAFDRNGDVEFQIRSTKPDLVVDATGPFQNYGEEPYQVVKACITLGIHYMDLADGSDFVKNISQFDEDAKKKNIYILSGVSSFPVLSAAVVRRLSKGLLKINSITGGIAPSPYAGVGLNVIRAITTYAGKRLSLTRNKQKTYGYALTETMRYTISPPGYVPLNNTLFSLVDVPDLQVLPELWKDADSVWMGAGPVPEILHRMLIGLAWLVKIKLLPSLLPFASLFHFVINILRWGEHRGGMFILVKGNDNEGKEVERSWHLLAEKGDGPFIPSMAIEAIVRKSLAGKSPAIGARPATQDLELEDYENIFKTKTIYTGQREKIENKNSEFLYENILGDAYNQLPEAIQNYHKGNYAEGLATVETGKSLLAKLAVKIMGFPTDGKDIPVKVLTKRENGAEGWYRDFDGKKFSSFQAEGKGYAERLITEKIGFMNFDFALVVENEKLHLVLRHWNFLGVPLPLFLAPNGDTFEYVENGRFNFHVEIKHPLTGLIVKYQGWLVSKSNS